MLALGAMMLTACDKVDEYTVIAGAVGEWSDGTSIANKDQRAFVEKYTGAHCVFCPDGDKAIEAAHETYGDKMIAVAIDGPGTNGEPFEGEENTHTEDGDAWAAYFGVNTMPAVLINRGKEGGKWQLNTTMSTIASEVGKVVTESAPIAVAIESHSTGAKTNIVVSLEFLEDVEEPLTLTVLTMEDSIKAKQLIPGGVDKDYMHNHVLRDVITDLWGMEVDAKGTKGECRKVMIAYEMQPNWKLEHCHLVAFVSKKESREILNSAACKF